MVNCGRTTWPSFPDVQTFHSHAHEQLSEAEFKAEGLPWKLKIITSNIRKRKTTYNPVKEGDSTTNVDLNNFKNMVKVNSIFILIKCKPSLPDIIDEVGNGWNVWLILDKMINQYNLGM